MRKIIITYGLISGAIIAALMFISMPLMLKGVITYENGMWVGYTTMVISLSLVFFGLKSFRDNYQRGKLSFWTGIKIGLLITLISSLFYATAWEIAYNTVFTDFIEKYTQCQVDKLKSDHVSGAEMEKEMAKLQEFGEMYKNPLFRFPMTMVEILPVGILITLISAALLRKKELLPAA